MEVDDRRPSGRAPARASSFSGQELLAIAVNARQEIDQCSHSVAGAVSPAHAGIQSDGPLDFPASLDILDDEKMTVWLEGCKTWILIIRLSEETASKSCGAFLTTRLISFSPLHLTLINGRALMVV